MLSRLSESKRAITRGDVTLLIGVLFFFFFFRFHCIWKLVSVLLILNMGLIVL
jgi:hypothetical protein